MTEENTTEEGTTSDTYAKGSWQALLATSEKRRVLGSKNNKAASELLWSGAKAGINEWLPNATDDTSAEGLYSGAMEALGGTHRKGDASKIKTVALAVRDKGLNLSDFENLSKAYKEAKRLTTTAEEHKAEDEAVEKAISSIDAPEDIKATPEGAAAFVLSQGVDEAARLLLDALGPDNNAAHRAFMRAVSEEVAGRVKPKAKPTPKAGPKDGAQQATAKAAPKAKAVIDPASAKPKAAPVSSSKGDPNKKALPPKAEQKKAAPVKKAAPKKTEPVKAEAEPTIFDGEDTSAPKKAAPIKAAPKKAAPVKRTAPVKRAAPVKR